MPAPQVVASAMSMCTFGLGPSVVQILPVNRILSSAMPAGNIQDFVPFMNIVPFPLCASPANPIVIAQLGVPGACLPVVPGPWFVGDPTVINGSMPALIMGSQCVCAYGGLISPIIPGQFTEIA